VCFSKKNPRVAPEVLVNLTYLAIGILLKERN
jgi:hypothetical protein